METEMNGDREMENQGTWRGREFNGKMYVL